MDSSPSFPATMRGVVLPGDSTVSIREFPVPIPGPGQVLLRMRASSICGSDIRAIYRKHLGVGPEGYQGVIGGHEPCGEIVATGPSPRRFKVGDRVIVYHISGCGCCNDCHEGYMISCTSPEHRRAHGWQRDGGHAEYMVAEENTCIPLPKELSFVDGALVACGFGTVYEALLRLEPSGLDRLLITGLGPVGMAAGLVAQAMGVTTVIGLDVTPERLQAAKDLGAVHHAIPFGDDALAQIHALTDGLGCEKSLDCSGNGAARSLALSATRRWGRVAFVGEGNRVDFDVSHALIHKQISIHGSWVTSTKHMEDLAGNLVRWNLRPEKIVTHRFTLDQAAEAYRTMDEGRCGKVVIVMD